MRPHGSSIQLERRRLQAAALMEQGWRPTQIARHLNTTLRSVERWMNAYRHGGPTVLKAIPSPGRPPKLSARRKQALVNCLLRGAIACGFSTDLWTSRRIAEVIRRRWGVSYHVDAIPRLMAGLGFSPSKAAGSGQGTRRAGHSPVD
jgi:transposase